MNSKSVKIAILFFQLLSFSVYGYATDIDTTLYQSIQKNINYTDVIVCSGEYAYAYHSRNNCPGLNNCQGKLYTVSEYDAIHTYSRKACCRCWRNVASNCHDDNPSNSRNENSNSDASAAYGYLALAVVATGAILLSNEAYVASAYSFNPPLLYYRRSQSVEEQSRLGWLFQVRKNFNHSNLEYGGGFINYKYTVIDSARRYFDKFESKVWRINLDYVHNVFYNTLPDKVNIFLGPAINYEFEQTKVGFGGVIGMSYQIFDRIKIDARYERTTTTNQVYAGLQFLYQKKYFWKK